VDIDDSIKVGGDRSLPQILLPLLVAATGSASWCAACINAITIKGVVIVLLPLFITLCRFLLTNNKSAFWYSQHLLFDEQAGRKSTAYTTSFVPLYGYSNLSKLLM